MCVKEVVQPYKSDREGGKVLEGRVWIKMVKLRMLRETVRQKSKLNSE